LKYVEKNCNINISSIFYEWSKITIKVKLTVII